MYLQKHSLFKKRTESWFSLHFDLDAISCFLNTMIYKWLKSHLTEQKEEKCANK